MKRKLIIITIVALSVSACSVSMQTAGNYVDDIYYWPGDETPALLEKNITAPEKGTEADDKTVIISELGVNDEGENTLDNYIYADNEPDWFDKVQTYNLNQLDSTSNDTIYIPTDNDEEYLVNNYFVDDDLSYADRIQMFYDPYYYYYDYDPWWNFSIGWNWYYPYYGGYYFYWGNPWYYDPFYFSFYDPWYYGGWYGYYNWYVPYYSHHDGHYWTYNRRDDYNGNRRSRRPNTVYSGAGVTSSIDNSVNARAEGTISKSVSSNNRRNVVNDNTTIASTQKSVGARTSVSNDGVLTEKRRNTSNAVTSRAVRSTTQAAANIRNAVTNTSTTRSTVIRRNYTPSYNTPRSNTRATYNRSNSNYRTTSSGRTYSGSGNRSSYSIPSTSSSSSRSSIYRSAVSRSRSYSTSFSGSSTRSRYYSPSRSSGSSSSSSYSRSYSSGRSSHSSSGGSYSGGGSRSSGSSSHSSGGRR